MLEHAMPYCSQNSGVKVKLLLIKLYSKLGLSKSVSQLSKLIKYKSDYQVERVSSNKLSVIVNYGQTD